MFLEDLFWFYLDPVVVYSLCGVVFLIAFFCRSLLWQFFSVLAVYYYFRDVDLLYWQYLAVTVLVLGVPFIRQFLVSFLVMKLFIVLKFLPQISETELAAIDSGDVWLEGDLFSGKPNLSKMREHPSDRLTKEEQAFLDGPVHTLCEMVDDWDVHQKRDFSKPVWDFIKKEGFFGLIIPKSYGGRAFSPSGCSAVIAKLSSRSSALGITVMVPNSLGPAELLIHYGTKRQQDHYLPRLAIGEDVPCFGLTEVNAGSDAGSLTSSGTLFKRKDGSIGIRLQFQKRWITLSAVSTVIGLAFRCYDPEELLGKGTDLGITCALISSKAKGVKLGNRHDPLGVPFVNAPFSGKNVEIGLSDVIGEEAGIGKGWRMLMECLAAGRGISLPAASTGGAKMATRVSCTYTMLRKQFGVSVGKFEGVQDALGEMAGLTYVMEAMRRFTCSGLDQGVKPPIVTAMVKYYSTEMVRTVVNHAMDVMGGKAISRGPRNVMAHPYMGLPIGVTVEGANILTRTLIVFGQGAIRCHPYVLKEFNAINDEKLRDFDRAFFGHLGLVVRNFCRVLVRSIWTPILMLLPVGPRIKYYAEIKWSSAKFSLMADMALGLLGGQLKRKEIITGRFTDILAWMYFSIAVLTRFENEGKPKDEWPFVHFALHRAHQVIGQSFSDIARNLGLPFKLLHFISPQQPFQFYYSDKVKLRMVGSLQRTSDIRDRLSEGCYVSEDESDPVGCMEAAFKLQEDLEPVLKRLKTAQRKKRIKKGPLLMVLPDALEKLIIDEQEFKDLTHLETLREEVIAVDDFTPAAYKNIRP